MSIAPYIKEIGRGKEGARSLTQAQAYDLMSQVLDGRVTDLEVGAFCIAMRIKGESTDELAGFLEATQERCVPIPAAAHRHNAVVLLPSYNGARKLPNLTAACGHRCTRAAAPPRCAGARRQVSARSVPAWRRGSPPVRRSTRP